MEDFMNFMSGGKTQKRKVFMGSSSRSISKDEFPIKEENIQPPAKKKKYAETFVEKFKDRVWRRFDQPGNVPDRQFGIPEEVQNGKTFYDLYDFERKIPNNLPIIEHRSEILNKIRNNPVVVLQGPTGCGKTTQVPQYILDDHRRKRLYCNIIVAQPRRIAAATNARRVCSERGWSCGTIVGYQVGSDQQANRSPQTRILFCTTGVLVEKLIHNENPLENVTHIILDEVHERDMDMDFLMILVYKYLNPDLRVILMSATINTKKFAEYYQIPYNGAMIEAPIIQLDVERRFDVGISYLDDFEDLEMKENFKEPMITEQMYRFAVRLIIYFDTLDRVSKEDNDGKSKPAVLVFLPGIYEIKQMYARLETWVQLNKKVTLVRIIMHSTMNDLNSEVAMQSMKGNIRKVILATNIAESSITVPDVKYVIDFCLTKTLITNPETNFPSLQLQWASRDNCVQRAGRTGRVMNGLCFRLVSEEFFYKKMRKSALAELQTNPLENIVLKAKQLNIGKPEEVLALAMDKPDLDDIANTVIRLKEMGALLCTTNGHFIDRDGDLTYMGEIMTRLPINVKLTRLILFGYCFGILNDCIIIAAALNCTKQMFKTDMLAPVKSYTKHLEFANGSGSDLFALLNAYKQWKSLRAKGYFGMKNSQNGSKIIQKAEKDWANSNNIEIASLRECDEYVRDLRIRIQRLGIIEQKSNWNERDKYIVLKVVIAGAFYPNYFARGTKFQREDMHRAYNTLGGRDPTDTVYFQDCPNEFLPHIYMEKIKEIFYQNDVVDKADLHRIKINHDGVSKKLFVTFNKTGKEDDIQKYGVACHPGFVLTEVYKAIKLRRHKQLHTINVFTNRNTAIAYAKENGLLYNLDGTDLIVKDPDEYQNVCLPRKMDRYVMGHISHTENCGRFWVQPIRKLSLIKQIFEEMNNSNNDLEAFRNVSEVRVGQIVAAEFPNERNMRNIEYHRAKIIAINSKPNNLTFTVRFIDFGNIDVVNLKALKRLRGVATQYMEVPSNCFECSLAKVQPSQVNAPDGVWQTEANKEFMDKTDGEEIEIEVYSIVNGIVRAIVKVKEENINDYLRENGFADFCDESHVSKADYWERRRTQLLHELNSTNYLTSAVIKHLIEEDTPTIKAPTKKDGHLKSVELKGPTSPIEIQLYGLSNGASNQVKIDSKSVNSVLLENEPNDVSAKHLVSVCATQMDKDCGIVLRQTTLLPNIRVFAPLMAAIFAPRIQLAQNAEKTYYVSMITGLGRGENAKAISPNSDMVFELDAEITNDDLTIVNNIRKSMSELLTGYRTMNNSRLERINQLMERIQGDIIKLIAEPRLMIEDHHAVATWMKYEKSDIYYGNEKDLDKHIFPRHSLLKLDSYRIDRLVQLKKNDELLHDEERSGQIETRKKCLLCRKDHIDDLRFHLMSRQHLDRVQAIEKAEKNIKI